MMAKYLIMEQIGGEVWRELEGVRVNLGVGRGPDGIRARVAGNK